MLLSARFGGRGEDLINLMYWAAALGAGVAQLAASSPPAAPLPDPQSASAVASDHQIEAAPVAPLTTLQLAADTPVKLVVDESMLSDQVAAGHRFPIYLAEPVIIGGRTVLPVGIRGEGEVIDAKRSSGGGGGGGIVVNARFLMCGTTRIALGKMHLGAAGKDSVRSATVATAAVGIFGMLVRGHNAQIQQGTLADAKIIANVELPATCERTGPKHLTVQHEGGKST
jgi:hypothetical protein